MMHKTPISGGETLIYLTIFGGLIMFFQQNRIHDAIVAG